MPTLQEKIRDLKGTIEDRQARMAQIFAEAGPDCDMDKVKCIDGDSTAKVAKIRELNAELTDLRKQLDDSEEILKASLAVGSASKEPIATEAKAEPGQVKSFATLIAESGVLKSRHVEKHLDIDVKTLMQTSAGWSPESRRSGLVVEEALRPIQLTDLLPTDTIDQAAYKYMEETTFTNNAAEAAQGGTYGEAALVLTERSKTVEKVAVWLPITDEQLEDVPGVSAYIDRRLRFMLRQRFDYQIAQGDGITPNLQGILNLTGIQTQAKGTDPVPDAIYKAMTKVRVTGRAFPNAVVLHPNDWQGIRLLKTSDGIYIWGSPSEAGPELIWGIRVVQADSVTENTGVVGDFANFSNAFIRRGIDVQITNAHDTYFIQGKQAVRADFRAVLVWTRPEAFCTVTGI
jgi:HK97 family phage major capsid protein